MNDAAGDPLHEQSGDIGLVSWSDFHSPDPFTFECGQVLPEFTLRYETYGHLNAARDNAVLVCHALSGDHHCAGIHTINDKRTGWWNNMIGPGKPIDTNRYFVVCSNCIGGCRGSTGPSSVNPATGDIFGMDFPFVTIRDMVRAQRRLIDHLQISQLACVIGGSMGGMQVLQWAIEYPEMVRSIIPMATTSCQNAQAIAFNQVGRQAILQDPEWNNGRYGSGSGPNVGLSIARMMAHITYLSDKGMEAKFGRRRRADGEGKTADRRFTFHIDFEVESYLEYQGRSFLNLFDARTYLYFTRALDYFDLPGHYGSLEKAFANLQSRVLVVGFTSDWLFPPVQNREIVIAMLREQKEASYAEIEMDYGHDSFLLDSPELYRLVADFLRND